MTRTSASLKNLAAALIGQAVGIIISFFSRQIFLRCLSEEYLGINGLFTNILTVLSLAELGVGTAMTFSLYKPLAENDIPLIKSLMRLYKRAYTAIGASVLLLALIFTPFYTVFMDEVPDIPHLTEIYLLYAANTGISYFFTYKRSLIICDQKRYVNSILHYCCYFLMNIAQIVFLLISGNYLLFITVQVIFTLTENIAVSVIADRMYPYLNEKDILPLPEENKQEISKNIRAMFFHKIGDIVVRSTDNILISKFISLTAAGIYSNYMLITDALNKVISQVFASLTASVGNLNAGKEDRAKLITSFYRVFFLSFWIYGFSFVCLICLFNPFILLWLGEDRPVFGMGTVTIICASFYLSGMRKAALTYREAAGAFYFDRYKPIAESVINLAASIILAKKTGISGIFLGTVISTLLTCIWVEPYVLYKHIFGQSVKKYFIRLGIYTLVTVITAGICLFVCSLISFSEPFPAFVLRAAVCAVLPNLIFFIIFGKTEEFAYFKGLILGIMGKLKAKLHRS